MLGLFVGDSGVCIIDGDDFIVPPTLSTSPHSGRDQYALRGTDAVFYDGEARVVAFYEQIPLAEFERAIREIGAAQPGRLSRETGDETHRSRDTEN